MTVTYLMLAFTSLILGSTYLYYKYTVKKGLVFRYKPMFLLIVAILFLLSLFGSIFGKPINEIVPFIG